MSHRFLQGPCEGIRAQRLLADRILTNYIYKDPSPKEGHLLRFHVDPILGALLIPAQGVTVSLAQLCPRKASCLPAKSPQLCPTLCDPMDCSPPGFSVHGILQARILEWVAVPSFRGSSRPRDQTHVSCRCCTAGRFSTAEPQGKPTDRHRSHLNCPERVGCVVLPSAPVGSCWLRPPPCPFDASAACVF